MMMRQWILGCSVALASCVEAATLTWTGGGAANNWNDSANWSGGAEGAVPTTGDSVVIANAGDAKLTLENDISGLSLAGLTVTGGKGVVLDGSQIELTGGASAWNSTGPVTVNCALKLAEGDQLFKVKDTTTVNGVISGKGKLVKTGTKGSVDGSGILELAGANTYEGGTEIRYGSLDALNVYAFGDTNREVYINNAAASPKSDHTALRIRVTSFYYPIHVLDTFTGGTTWCENNWCGHNVDAMVDKVSIYNRIYGGSFHLRGWEKDAKDSGSSRTVTVYGDIDSPGAFVSFYGGTCHFRGRIRAGSLGASPYTSTKVYLYHSKNEFTGNKGGTTSSYYAGADEVFHGARFTYSYLNSGDMTYLQGHDQTIDRADGTVPGAPDRGDDVAAGTKHTVDGGSGNMARLTMRATASCLSIFRYAGNLSLCWYPTNSAYAYTTCSNRVNTMTGPLIVSNGTFAVTGQTTFRNVPTLVVASGACFRFGDVNPFGDGTVDVVLGRGARLDLNGLDLAVRTLSVDGEFQPARSYGAGVIPEVTGNGELTVRTRPKTIVPAIWTGEGATPGVTDVGNWNVDRLPDLEADALLPTFAVGGATAVVDRAVNFDGIRFDVRQTDGFALTASAAGEVRLGAAGIEIASPEDDAIKGYVLAAPVSVGASSTWQVPSGVKLTLAGPLRAGSTESALTMSGGGTVEARGDGTGTFGGNVSLTTSVDVHGVDPFGCGGPSGGLVTIAPPADGRYVVFHDCELTKPLVLSAQYPEDRDRVSLKEGCTAVFLNVVTNRAAYWMMRGGRLVFNGGFSGNLPVFVEPNDEVVFAGGRVSVDLSGNESRKGWYVFSTPSNDIPRLKFWYGANVRTTVDDVFWKGVTDVSIRRHESYGIGNFDLHGTRQRVGTLSGATGCAVYSYDGPARLELAAPASVTNHASFRGDVTLRLDGEGSYSLDAASTSRGAIEVARGTLELLPGASWEDARAIEVSSPGRIRIVGVDNVLRVKALVLDGVSMPAGTYGASSSDLILGDGRIQVMGASAFDGDVVIDAATCDQDLPVVASAGEVRLPEAARIVFRGWERDAFVGRWFTLATGSPVVAPTSFGRWTFSPALHNHALECEAAGGALRVRVVETTPISCLSGASLKLGDLAEQLPLVLSATNGQTYEAVGAAAFTLAADDSGEAAFSGVLSLVQKDSQTVRATWRLTALRDVSFKQLAIKTTFPPAKYAGGTFVLNGTEIPLPRDPPTAKTATVIRAGTQVDTLDVYDASGTYCFGLSASGCLSAWSQDSRYAYSNGTLSLSLYPAGRPNPDNAVAGEVREISFDITTDAPAHAMPTEGFVVSADDGWTPVVGDFSAVAAGSALDFSSSRPTDVPAGSMGRVVAVGDHFEVSGRPGAPQRFYGVDVAPLEEGTDIEGWAAGLARLGYNAIRLHGHDNALTVDDDERTTLDPKVADIVDRMVAACVRNGIYVTTDLYVNRRVKWRAVGVDLDGVIPESLFKTHVMIHEGMQENLCRFVRAFLTHRNPYTGRSLAEEPALMSLSLVNEGIVGTQPTVLTNSLPAWAEGWTRWLAEKQAAEPEAYGWYVATNIDTNTSVFRRFLQETESAFAKKMRAFVRDELGCDALVANGNGAVTLTPNWMSATIAYQLNRDECYDYVDQHHYNDHPTYLGQYNGLPAVHKNTQMIRGANAGLIGSWTRLADRPFVLTEFNHVAPNRYRSNAGLLVGSTAALQNWSGLWRHSWSEGLGQSAISFFTVNHDPIGLASERAAWCLFARGDLDALADAYVVTVDPSLRTGRPQSALLRKTSEFPNGFAGWYARIGMVVSNAVPSDAVSAGGVDEAFVRTRAETWAKLGLSETDGRMPLAGDGHVATDPLSGAFSVTTPRTDGVFTEEGGACAAGVLSVDVPDAPASVWVSSLDGLPLVRSRRMLLTHLTDALDVSTEFGDRTRTFLRHWGSLPHLMKNGKARIALDLDKGAFSVYALRADGTRYRQLDSVVDVHGRLTFTVDVAADPESATWCYEIVRHPEGVLLLFK